MKVLNVSTHGSSNIDTNSLNCITLISSIPAYNDSSMIVTAIQSMLNQTHKNLES